jgi:hypothetical protein
MKGAINMKSFMIMLVVVLILILGIIIVWNNSPSHKNDPEKLSSDIGESVNNFLVPSPTIEVLPDPEVIVKDLKKMARLETFSETFTESFEATKNADQLWGLCEESLTLSVCVEVIAGVDLEKITTDNVRVLDHESIIIYIPQAEILVVDMDNVNTYVKESYQAIFAFHDPDLETITRQYADEYIKNQAIDSHNILKKANDNAREVIQSCLEMCGFKNVYFSNEPLGPENDVSETPMLDNYILDLVP